MVKRKPSMTGTMIMRAILLESIDDADLGVDGIGVGSLRYLVHFKQEHKSFLLENILTIFSRYLNKFLAAETERSALLSEINKFQQELQFGKNQRYVEPMSINYLLVNVHQAA
uniref:Uncharacterized protein n=1 Tax=Onchocerca volvulus TaxID=6282 RepID=A0A8R1XUX1_ONCVO